MYTAAIKADGHRPEAHYNTGLLQLARGQKATNQALAKTAFARARDAFRAAADRAPADVKVTAELLAKDAEAAFVAIAAAEVRVKQP
jgi:hypothetical protein